MIYADDVNFWTKIYATQKNTEALLNANREGCVKVSTEKLKYPIGPC